MPFDSINGDGFGKIKNSFSLSSYNSGLLEIIKQKRNQKKVAIFVLFFMVFQVLSPFGSIVRKGGAHAISIANPTTVTVATISNPSVAGTFTGGGTDKPIGQTFKLTAVKTPSSNYYFHKWSGDCTGETESIDITPTKNITCIANYSYKTDTDNMRLTSATATANDSNTLTVGWTESPSYIAPATKYPLTFSPANHANSISVNSSITLTASSKFTATDHSADIRLYKCESIHACSSYNTPAGLVATANGLSGDYTTITLTPGVALDYTTKYAVYVEPTSKDQSNAEIVGWDTASSYEFITAAATGTGAVGAPGINANTISATNISLNSATISWNVDSTSDAEVQYGTTNGYGQSVNNATLMTAGSRSITLTNLKPNTLYHYRVMSMATSGGFSAVAVSGDYTFSTSSGFSLSVSTVSTTDDSPGGSEFTYSKVLSSSDCYSEIQFPASCTFVSDNLVPNQAYYLKLEKQYIDNDPTTVMYISAIMPNPITGMSFSNSNSTKAAASPDTDIHLDTDDNIGTDTITNIANKVKLMTVDSTNTGTVVNSSVTWNTAYNRIVINPHSSLNTLTKYFIWVNDIKDANGNSARNINNPDTVSGQISDTDYIFYVAGPPTLTYSFGHSLDHTATLTVTSNIPAAIGVCTFVLPVTGCVPEVPTVINTTEVAPYTKTYTYPNVAAGSDMYFKIGGSDAFGNQATTLGPITYSEPLNVTFNKYLGATPSGVGGTLSLSGSGVASPLQCTGSTCTGQVVQDLSFSVTVTPNAGYYINTITSMMCNNFNPISPSSSAVTCDTWTFSQEKTVNFNFVQGSPPAATITVPTITTQPASATVTAPAAATFTVAANANNGTLSYQWKSAPSGSTTFSDISGATSATYTTSATATTDTGKQYKVVVTNSAGPTTSNAATLTVNAAGTVTVPTITTQPASATVTAPAAATFTVAANANNGTLSYQWQSAPSSGGTFTDISGATSATYTTSATATTDTGKQYKVVVTNSAGPTTSNAATLTVNAAGTAVFDITSADSTVSKNGVSVDFGTASPTFTGAGFNMSITGATATTHTLPAEKSLVKLYDITPSTTLTGAYLANIVLAYPSGQTYAEGDTVQYWNGSAWSTSGITVTGHTTNTITFTTSHFSEYAILTAASGGAIDTTTGGTVTTGTSTTLPVTGNDVVNLLLNMLLALAIEAVMVLAIKKSKYSKLLA